MNVSSEKLLVFDPKEDNSFFYHGVKQNNRDFTKKANRDVHFVFDRVFSTEHTNQDVFEGTTKDVVDAVLDGFNCSGNFFIYPTFLCSTNLNLLLLSICIWSNWSW